MIRCIRWCGSWVNGISIILLALVEIDELEKRLRRVARDNETSVRLQTMPGIGPVTAAAIEAFAPPMATFKRGRDFAAWLGLVPPATLDRRQAEIGPDVEEGAA